MTQLIMVTNNLESGWYLASTANVRKVYDCTLGIMYSSARPSIYKRHVDNPMLPWGLDNSVFTGKFRKKDWLKAMKRLEDYRDSCLFVVVPDVIGSALGTIKRFHKYRKLVKDYPLAFVSQDGIQEFENDIPWDLFDCLFMGGTDLHKFNGEGDWIIREAKKRKKWVHVGRVNSRKRILRFSLADSWDGTKMSFQPSRASLFHSSVLYVRSLKKTKGLFDDLYNTVS